NVPAGPRAWRPGGPCAGARQPDPERAPLRAGRRPHHGEHGAEGRRRAPERHRRGIGAAAVRGRARIRALLARRSRQAGLRAGARDRARHGRAARRARHRTGIALHDRTPCSQGSLRVSRYNARIMKIFRRLSTRRLVLLAAALAVLAAAAGTISVTAFGGGGSTPPPKPLADAVHDALTASEPQGITARIAFTNNLFPSGSLLGSAGSAELAWDAVQGVPLRVAIYAQGNSSPVLELKATDMSFGAVSTSDVDVSPPADAKVVDLNPPSGQENPSGTTQVTGLDAVQKQLSFTLSAPDSLVGLPRQTVQLIGGTDKQGALVVYGEGLGAIVVVERPADTANANNGNAMSGLPPISINGVTGHELATQLGTVVLFQRDGVSYVLAGSMPSAAAEVAARALK